MPGESDFAAKITTDLKAEFRGLQIISFQGLNTGYPDRYVAGSGFSMWIELKSYEKLSQCFEALTPEQKAYLWKFDHLAKIPAYAVFNVTNVDPGMICILAGAYVYHPDWPDYVKTGSRRETLSEMMMNRGYFDP